MGIISMLDEECVVPKGTDMTYAQKLNDQHLNKHPSFIKPPPPKGKQADAHFALKHYAGVVRYNVSAWLEKNKDPLNDTVVAVLKHSEVNKLLPIIWADYQTQEEAAAAAKEGGGRKKGKSGSMMTVSMKYRESLNNLMTMLQVSTSSYAIMYITLNATSLQSTHPHFVRCLIPNEQKKSGMLEATLVMNQLTCNGVLEGIRICRKGFPNRMQHDVSTFVSFTNISNDYTTPKRQMQDFKLRYAILAADAAKSSDDAKVCCAAILEEIVKTGELNNDEFRVGHTKIFFKVLFLLPSHHRFSSSRPVSSPRWRIYAMIGSAASSPNSRRLCAGTARRR